MENKRIDFLKSGLKEKQYHSKALKNLSKVKLLIKNEIKCTEKNATSAILILACSLINIFLCSIPDYYHNPKAKENTNQTSLKTV